MYGNQLAFASVNLFSPKIAHDTMTGSLAKTYCR